jgi:formylglycine-generating enzyme required for sulfatase activity
LDIDIAEVSHGDYQDWLDTSPGLELQPGGCAWNDAFEPSETCMNDPAVDPDSSQPQVCVDWCDAHTYCAAQGRRLCGRIAGGMNDFDAYDDPSSSQWMNACTAGGQYEWTTGGAPTPDPIGCVHSGSQVTKPYAVGTHANCRSPSPGYQHLRDLSGNVEEWEDSCEVDVSSPSADKNDACRTRGGSFESARNETRCDAVPASAKQRSAVSPTLGFRCCG